MVLSLAVCCIHTARYIFFMLVGAFFSETNGTSCGVPGVVLEGVALVVLARTAYFCGRSTRSLLRRRASLRTSHQGSRGSHSRVELRVRDERRRRKYAFRLIIQTLSSFLCLVVFSVLPSCRCSSLATILVVVAIGGCVCSVYDIVLYEHYLKAPEGLCVIASVGAAPDSRNVHGWLVRQVR